MKKSEGPIVLWKRTLLNKSPFMKREYRTVSAMIHLYCRDCHPTGNSGLCPSCQELLIYARTRLEKCPYAEEKPACSACPTHCYRPERRRQIQKVMRYAGPRMMRLHPILAIRHLIGKFRRSSTGK